MRGTRWLAPLAVFMTVVLLSPSACAHEQEILNVILVEDESRPGNVTDSAFVEGNGLVFRMRDDTANASMQVRIDLLLVEYSLLHPELIVLIYQQQNQN